jgi:hypothetical protein
MLSTSQNNSSNAITVNIVPKPAKILATNTNEANPVDTFTLFIFTLFPSIKIIL